MNAYIGLETKNPCNKEFAAYGLFQLGCYVQHISYKDVPNIEFTNEDIFYGNVGFISTVVKKYGYPEKPLGHVPDEMMPFAGRTVELVTISQAKERAKTEKVFIKPVPENSKQFTGFVMNNSSLDGLYLVDYLRDDKELVLLSPEVNIVSEWRCFVHKGEIIDAKHYHGNYRIVPDYTIGDKCVNAWKDSPIAYSCDLGITDKGETIVIECNDVMCLGLYGLWPTKAGRMIMDRWEEIHRNKRI